MTTNSELTPTQEMRKWIDLCSKLFDKTPEPERKKVLEDFYNFAKEQIKWV